MKRVLAVLMVFAALAMVPQTAQAASSKSTDWIVAALDSAGVVTEDNYILIYKMSLKGQSLQRTDYTASDCGEVDTIQLGQLAKISDYWYLALVFALPTNPCEWVQMGEAAIPVVDAFLCFPKSKKVLEFANFWGNYNDWFIDIDEADILVDSQCNAWGLTGFIDRKTFGKSKEKGLFALTMYTGLVSSNADLAGATFSGDQITGQLAVEGQMSNDDGEALTFDQWLVPHLTAPGRHMQTPNVSMQLLSTASDLVTMDKLIKVKDALGCDAVVWAPKQFDGCLHGYVDWYNSRVNCFEFINVNVQLRLEKAMGACPSGCILPD